MRAVAEPPAGTSGCAETTPWAGKCRRAFKCAALTAAKSSIAGAALPAQDRCWPAAQPVAGPLLGGTPCWKALYRSCWGFFKLLNMETIL